MSYKFSRRSASNLGQCHVLLQELFSEVIKHVDCAVVWGHRGKADQNKAYKEGKSKKKWPEGKHNKKPSLAVDVAPCVNGRITWDKSQCYYFAGKVNGIASMIGVSDFIRWGGDWNGNENLKDQKLFDLVHWEVK